MKYIDEMEISNKKIILRCDFNVPIKDGQITDDTRITSALKTINYLLDHNCGIIILSHMGRIKIRDDKLKYSLRPVADYLSKILNKSIKFIDNPVGMEVLKTAKELKNGQVILLENTRFCDFPEKLESNNDLNLAKYWASLGDIFVNDAFGSLHRAHASVAGISKYIPSCFGYLVKEEIEKLTPLVSQTPRPYGVFMGGAKVEDKLKYIKDLLPKCDYLLIGGGIANSFLYACGYDVGDSLCTNDEMTLEELRSLVKTYKGKIIMPVDFVSDAGAIYDLGAKSINKFVFYLEKCKTIFINGTCGKFEQEKYALGTISLYSALKNISAVKIAGGGDTLNAINSFNLKDNFSFLSSGGGASLEYISTGSLAGINYINKQ